MSNKIFPTDTVAKSPIVAADLFLLADSADSNKVKDCTGAVINTFVRGAGGSIVMATGETIGIASGGNITFTDATVDLISLLGAAVKVGNGTPTQTQAAEDLYVEGKLEVDGILYSDGGAIFNEAGADVNFRIESDSNANMFFMDAGDSEIGIGGLPSGYLLKVTGTKDFAIEDTAAYDASPDATIHLRGTYKADGTTGDFVNIIGAKENATVDDYASYFAIKTRINGGALTERLRLSSAGVLTLTQNSDTLVFTGNGTNWAIDATGATEIVFNEASADLDFRIESNNNATMFGVDAGNEGYVYIGQTYHADVYNIISPQLFVKSNNTEGNGGTITCLTGVNNTVGAYIHFLKSRGTDGSADVVVQENDYIGGLLFYGADGVAFRYGAAFLAVVDGAVSGSDIPTRLTFWTTPDGSAAAVERMRIDNAGRIWCNSTPTAGVNAAFFMGNTTANMPLAIIAPTNGLSDIYFGDAFAAAGEYRCSFRYNHAIDKLTIDATGAASYDGTAGNVVISSSEVVWNENGADIDFRIESDTITAALGVDAGSNYAYACNFYPSTDDTYYLGKNDDDSPAAWKGVIVKDTTNGKYYRVEVINGTITATDLTD